MKLALALISHSLQMLWHNRMPLVRMTVPLLLIFELLSFTVGTLMPDNGMGPASLTTVVMAFVFHAWIAVVWHRYVLLSEGQAGIIPVVNANFVGRYVLTTIVLGILVGIAVLLGIVGMSLVWLPLSGGRSLWESGQGVLILSVLLLLVFGVWLTQRLGLTLTSAAVGERLGLGESWTLTRPISGTLWIAAAVQVAASLLALVVVGIVIAIGTPMLTAIAAPLGIVFGLAVTFVFSWVVLVAGVTMLTTIYGHVVEGRELVPV